MELMRSLGIEVLYTLIAQCCLHDAVCMPSIEYELHVTYDLVSQVDELLLADNKHCHDLSHMRMWYVY